MCACKETDVIESPNDSTFADKERQGSHGETCYVMFDENPVSSLPERGVLIIYNALTTNINNSLDEFNKIHPKIKFTI
jgi:hypothetical protein